MDQRKFSGRMAEVMRQAIADGLTQEEIVAAFEEGAQPPAESTVVKEVPQPTPRTPPTRYPGRTFEKDGIKWRIFYIEDAERTRAGFRYLLELYGDRDDRPADVDSPGLQQIIEASLT